MLIEEIEQLKDWLTSSLAPICEADPGALAKYVVALVKKDKPLQELRDSCSEQLDVFLLTKTKDFVETLFEVLDNKSYITRAPEAATTPTQDEKNETEVILTVDTDVPGIADLPDATPTSSDQQVTSTSKLELKKDEEVREAFPIGEVKRRRSRSISPKAPRPREDGDRRKFDERRLGYNRNYPRRRSTSPRYRAGPRARSPYRRRSPYRPIRRSRSPPPRGVKPRGERSWSRSRSRSPRKSPARLSRSRSRERIVRSRSPGGRLRSRSPGGRIKSRSPFREGRAWSPRARSPYRRSVSPRYRSRSPRRRSPGRLGSRSRSLSPRRSGSGSPPRKVRRQSPDDSRGPTPTQENGMADSTMPTPSNSQISVVSQPRRQRCRDYDEKGFCVRGDLCMFDHGNDPVIVDNVAQFPGGPPPPGPGLPPMPGPPPHMPPGHINMGLPPPGFFTGRMPGPHAPQIHVKPDFHQEPYNPEAPGLSRPNLPPPPWAQGPMGMPPFMRGPPPMPQRTIEQQRLPVHARLGNKDLINVTVKNEDKDEPEDDEDVPSSSSRTVIAPKQDPVPDPVLQPPPPGIPIIQPPAPGPHPRPNFNQHHRFHPYHQRQSGPRKQFDFNRVGGYRRPDQSNCTLEVRKIPADFNNISKINEHFGQFGGLTNIQVKYEADPEAALVTFSANHEALACYKCSDPVFNNRFIKVFWHQKNKDNSKEQPSVSTTTQGATPQEDSSQTVPRPSVIPHPSQLQLNNLTKKSTESGTSPADTTPKVTTPPAELGTTYTSSMGTINKSAYIAPVYNAPAYNAAALKAKAAAQQAMVSPTAVTAADYVSRIEKMKQLEAMKKEAAIQKLGIQKQKHELLEKQIEQQKKLIATVEKNKDMKEANKKAIMQTLKTLTNSIDKLKAELGGRGSVIAGTAAVTSSGAAGAGVKSPEQAKKEILDMELELMTKTTSGEDTAELQKKLNELTKMANSMGLLGARGRGRGRGAVARGRGSLVWTATGLAPLPQAATRGRGRGGMYGAVASRSLDRRPKVLEVTGFDKEEKEEVHTHLMELRGVETATMEGDTTVIVTFKTRKEAELGILHGSRFKTKTLKMQWHVPKPDFTRSASTTSADTDDHEDIDEEALLAGVDDEEEEDTEERSWRP